MIRYKFYDRFADPFDWFNNFKGEWDPFGTPFDITGEWIEPVSIKLSKEQAEKLRGNNMAEAAYWVVKWTYLLLGYVFWVMFYLPLRIEGYAFWYLLLLLFLWIRQREHKSWYLKLPYWLLMLCFFLQFALWVGNIITTINVGYSFTWPLVQAVSVIAMYLLARLTLTAWWKWKRDNL